ncbi:hypothetical protein D918_08182 [Trichuris suis]|nr:hypothetical protein D918_08182 [Trichuris suis]
MEWMKMARRLSLNDMKMLLCFLLLSALTKEIVGNGQSSVSSEMLTKDTLETSVDNRPGRIGKRQVNNPTLVEGVSTGNLPVIEPTELKQTNREEGMVMTTVTRTDMKETSSSSEEETTTVATLKPESKSTEEEKARKLQKSEFEKTRQERSMTDDGIKTTRTGTTSDGEQQLQIPGTKEATTTDESIGRMNKRATSVSSSTEEVPTPQ